jgi:hypothetical protein
MLKVGTISALFAIFKNLLLYLLYLKIYFFLGIFFVYIRYELQVHGVIE